MLLSVCSHNFLSSKTVFNSEKFHNQLALHLGYERIVKNKRFNIKIEDADVPMIRIDVVDTLLKINFRASETADEVMNNPKMKALGLEDEINTIINVVHDAYIESTKEIIESITLFK